MGGEGPYVEFASDELNLRDLNVERLSDKELEAAYSRARTFLLSVKSRLEDEHGWKASNLANESDLLFSVTNEQGRVLELPQSFSSFTTPAEVDAWRTTFSRLWSRGATRRPYYHIDDITPLQDTFYLLQCICPGMLIIVRIDDIDDIGELWSARVLPQTTWIKEHEEVLKDVLGSTEHLERLLEGADSMPQKWLSRYDPYEYDRYENDMDEAEDFKDLTACDKECGYCGRCEY